MSAFERRWFVFFYPRGGRGLDLFRVYAIETQVYTQIHGFMGSAHSPCHLSDFRVCFLLAGLERALYIQTHTICNFSSVHEYQITHKDRQTSLQFVDIFLKTHSEYN